MNNPQRRDVSRSPAPPAFLASLLAPLLFALGCGPAVPKEAEWPPLGKKWYERASASYRVGDIEDAEIACENALKLVPDRSEVRTLAAHVALAQLEYDRAVQLVRGMNGQSPSAIRSRAYWYAGKINQAADELDTLLSDPEVRDPWATEVVKLARQGRGREPFSMSGGLLAVTEMPRVGSTSLIVPLEVDGEPALAMIATNEPEAVIDSSTGKESSWVSLRFAERVEVTDVPAMARDLSRVSRELNAPIKMLIGVNLLRHLHATFDFGGGQFVVRTFEPPPPPEATTVRVSYVRGGGMLLRGAFGIDDNAPWGSFLVNTSMTYPIALDQQGWEKAGVQLNSLSAIPNQTSVKQGTLPVLRLGAFEVPGVPGVLGGPVKEVEKGLDIELDGLVGSGLLAAFRVTLVDRGKTMWLEDMPREAVSNEALPEEAPLEGEMPMDGTMPPMDGMAPPPQLAPPAPVAPPASAPASAPKAPAPAPAPKAPAPAKPGPGGP